MLAVNHLHKAYARTKVLRGCDLAIHPGEIIGLFGRNGSGKSTLLHCIVGLVIPDQGTILIGGIDSYIPSSRTSVSFLPEEVAYEANYRCSEIVNLHAALSGGSGNGELSACGALKVVGLEQHANRKINKCSHGMARRVAAACALVGSPKLYVLDEPFVGMDMDSKDRYQEHLLNVVNGGASVLITSHSLDEVEPLCSRHLGMRNGEIVDLYDEIGCAFQIVVNGPCDESRFTRYDIQLYKTQEGRFVLELNNAQHLDEALAAISREGCEVVDIRKGKSLRERARELL